MGDRSCRKSPGRFLSPMICDPGSGQHARTAWPARILGRIVRSMSRTTNRTNPCAGTVPSIPARRSRKPHRLQCPARRSPRLRASSQRRCDGRGSRGLPSRPRKAAGAEDPGPDFPGFGLFSEKHLCTIRLSVRGGKHALGIVREFHGISRSRPGRGPQRHDDGQLPVHGRHARGAALGQLQGEAILLEGLRCLAHPPRAGLGADDLCPVVGGVVLLLDRSSRQSWERPDPGKGHAKRSRASRAGFPIAGLARA
ncbi:hypothetical protein ATH84_11043 [Paracoccus versutus]|uniref:Uncharacterized protein n=1 Tax=Paracoccus versutus TaxID=34007 RepID=A0AAQ0HBT3_PARVE|nr:hypothetical protein ATH84_11043 [Paracoccus versutus]